MSFFTLSSTIFTCARLPSGLWCSSGVYSRDYARRSKFLSDSLLFLSFIKSSICSISSSYSFFFFSTHALFSPISILRWLWASSVAPPVQSQCRHYDGFILFFLLSIRYNFLESILVALSVTMPSLCPEWYGTEVGYSSSSVFSPSSSLGSGILSIRYWRMVSSDGSWSIYLPT